MVAVLVSASGLLVDAAVVTAVDTCVLKACGGNATCTKNSAGVASCVCASGFVLQADKRTCTDTCVLQMCGNNAKCMKSGAGAASCVCDPGFVLQPDGVTCTDTCAIKACGENATCIKDSSTGAASCVCSLGFVLQADGRTCTDTCALKACQGNGMCIKNTTTGAASCVCNSGFALQTDGRTCTGPATCGSCPAGARCTVAFDYISYCICPPGYGLTSTGCISGATPTVSSTSITFYDQPNYTITPTTFTMRLDFNAYTTLPASIASRVWSTWRLDGAPGGVGECVSLNEYEQEGCTGTYRSYPSASDGTSMTCLGFT
ncbi:unnamed protein product [Closterium sp. Yama58-4]|nr:unnamed protein product [Closterium sp. Yama58-4]